MIQAVLGFATDLGERAGAWDEVYYTGDSTIDAAANSWFQTSGLLGLKRTSGIGRRLQCLSNQCYLYYVRLSVVGTRGASQVFTQKVDGYRSSENFAGDAAVFRCYDATRQIHREIRIGGLPDNVVDGNAVDVGFFKSYIAGRSAGTLDQSTFFGKLAAIGGVIKYRNTTIGGPSSAYITGSTKTDQYGLITLALANTITIPANTKVDISVRGQPQLRGRWTVASQPDSSHIILAGSQRVSCPPVFSGAVTIVTELGADLVTYDTPFLSSHKLGKKKYQRRGRQSPKLIRH